MVRRLELASLLMLLLTASLNSSGATDPRFFGTYCGDDTVKACGKWCLTPWGPCFTRCRDVAIEDVRVSVEYKEMAGRGTILGTGDATVDGKPLKLNVSAVVVGYGQAKGVVASNRFDAKSGIAQLASDGVSLTVSAMEQSIQLSKANCGNVAPSVSISAPPNNANLVLHSPALFRGDIKDDHDTSFPPERMSFASDRDGPLTGTVDAKPLSLEVTSSTLSPGVHHVTFSATDSGGMTATTSIAVTVANQLQYAAKFVCGKPPDQSAAPGRYFTTVNVENPSNGMVSFRKRFTAGLAEQKPGPISKYYSAQLEGGRAFRVECPEIMEALSVTDSFVEGFLVFETPDPLNIVAVYSAAGQSGFVETLDVQPVAGFRLPVKLPDLVAEAGCDLVLRVKNIGAADAPASTTKLAVGDQVQNLPTPAIPAGGFIVLPPVSVSHGGDFGFAVTADAGGQIAESSETNNVTIVNCIG
jgi:hypothetical protein